MQSIVLKQGSPEWLAWRDGGIGSSDAMVIAQDFGMIEKRSWMKSIDELYEEKVTGVSKTVVNAQMARGTKYEPVARRVFEESTGLVLQPLCGEMDGQRQIRASFDGITFDGRETIEIKCPDDKVHTEAKNNVIVDYYLPQVCHQALVAWGDPASWGDDKIVNFFSYVPETGDKALVTRHATDLREFATKLLGFELRFLGDLAAKTPPCGVDYAAEAAVYCGLNAKIKALNSQLAASKDKLIAIVEKQGRTSIDACGVTVLRVERAGTVDWERLAAEHAIGPSDIAAYRSQGTSFWQARAAKQKEQSAQQAA